MQNVGRQESAPGATGGGRYAQYGAEPPSADVSRLADATQETLARATQAAAQATDRLSQQTEALRTLQGRAMHTACTYVRAHPMAAVTIAIAVGLLLSRLTSRR